LKMVTINAFHVTTNNFLKV